MSSVSPAATTCGVPLTGAGSAEPVRLTLSGPHRAVTLASGSGGLWQRISSLFGRQALNDVRSQL